MSDDQYKSLPMFDASLAHWPLFQLKFRTMLESRDLLYVVDHQVDDQIPLNESQEDRDIRIAQGIARRKNDTKVCSLFINKLSDEALSIVEDLPMAFLMVKCMREQFQSNTAASALSRLDRLLDIEYKQGSEISTHLGTVNALMNQIRNAGGIDLDKLHVVILLRSMPRTAEWSGVITSLKALNEAELTKEKVARTFTETADEIA